jgi:hypothetical protein
MANQQNMTVIIGVTPRFDMYFGDQWAGGINSNHVAAFSLIHNGTGDAMRGKDNRGIRWHVVQFINENCALCGQPVNDRSYYARSHGVHRRVPQIFSRATSTMRTARSTPAQNPRGAAMVSFLRLVFISIVVARFLCLGQLLLRKKSFMLDL